MTINVNPAAHFPLVGKPTKDGAPRWPSGVFSDEAVVALSLLMAWGSTTKAATTKPETLAARALDIGEAFCRLVDARGHRLPLPLPEGYVPAE